MARAKILPGEWSEVTYSPVGIPLDDTGAEVGAEVVIPRSTVTGADGKVTRQPLPVGVTKGKPLVVHHDETVTVYMVTGWRGQCTLRDVFTESHPDGQTFTVRTQGPTKAAARTAAEERCREILRLNAEARQREADRIAAEAAARDADAHTLAVGDVSTTLGDLVRAWLALPAPLDRAGKPLGGKSIQDYSYAARHVLGHDIAEALPRALTRGRLEAFLQELAREHGSGAAKHTKALLGHALRIAMRTEGQGVADMHVYANPLAGITVAKHRARQTGLDPKRALQGAENAALLLNLYRDPAAIRWDGHRAKGGPKGSHAARANGKDVADLTAFLFSVGVRLGEALGLRWADVDLADGKVTIGGSVGYLIGRGVVRGSTKTAGSARTALLPKRTVAMLRRRARQFGVDLTDPDALARPVFGSPTKPEVFRDPRNTSRAISDLYAKYGVTFGRSHLGRKATIQRLHDAGVPLRLIAAQVGHASVGTTASYLDVSTPDDRVRAAL